MCELALTYYLHTWSNLLCLALKLLLGWGEWQIWNLEHDAIEMVFFISFTFLDILKLKRFKKIAWIQSHHLHLQWKFKLLAGKFTWGNKTNHCWLMSTKFLFSKFLLLHLKQTFLPIIWIFTEGEGDGTESRLPFRIFSNLKRSMKKTTLHWFNGSIVV